MRDRHALYGLFILLSGCCLARVNEEPSPGTAHLTIPRQEDGTPAIRIFAIKSKHSLVVQRVEPGTKVTSLTMTGKQYLLEIECERPGAGVVLHGGIEFDISVTSDTAYVLDCDPSPDPKYGYAEDNFALTRASRFGQPHPTRDQSTMLACATPLSQNMVLRSRSALVQDP
jgi:hypothetical protein